MGIKKLQNLFVFSRLFFQMLSTCLSFGEQLYLQAVDKAGIGLKTKKKKGKIHGKGCGKKRILLIHRHLLQPLPFFYV